jgi:hypothetical protein
MNRDRLVGAVATVVLVAGVPFLLVTCNMRREVQVSGSETPGFAGDESRPDDAPFEFAQPTTTAGPTTIPGGRPPSRRDRRTGANERAATSSTTTSTTTTTTIPRSVDLPPAEAISSICGMHDSIFSIQLIWTDRSIDVQRVVEQLQSNMDRYLEISPPDVRDEVDGLRWTIVTVADRLRQAGWNTDDPAVRQLLVAVRGQFPPFDQFVNRMNAIRKVETASCPT